MNDVISEIQQVIKQIRDENNQKSLVNKCDLFQAVTYYMFKDLGYEVILVSTQEVISNDVTGHSLLFISKDSYSFLVDLTYEQFFERGRCTSDNYMIDKEHNFIFFAPYPGYYYYGLYPQYLYKAQKLINDGFIIASEDNIKMYFDSFYLTKRGRFYDRIPTSSNISGKIYLNAILKSKQEVYHSKEELQSLGFSCSLDNGRIR